MTLNIKLGRKTLVIDFDRARNAASALGELARETAKAGFYDTYELVTGTPYVKIKIEGPDDIRITYPKIGGIGMQFHGSAADLKREVERGSVHPEEGRAALKKLAAYEKNT